VPKKIQGPGGASLGPTYDVPGGAVQLRTLNDEDVSLTHEMGGTIFSERLGSSVRRLSVATIGQSTAFNATLQDLPRTPFRILSVLVFADSVARVDHVLVSLAQQDLQREVPLYTFDITNGTETIHQIVDNGGAVASQSFLLPTFTQLPALGIGTGQKDAVSRMDALILRGVTAAFGAGTVTVVALVQVAFSDTTGQPVVRSRGLPIPGW